MGDCYGTGELATALSAGYMDAVKRRKVVSEEASAVSGKKQNTEDRK